MPSKKWIKSSVSKMRIWKEFFVIVVGKTIYLKNKLLCTNEDISDIEGLDLKGGPYNGN